MAGTTTHKPGTGHQSPRPGPGRPAGWRWGTASRTVKIVAAAGVLTVLSIAIVTVMAVEGGRPLCADARFGSAQGPLRRSPLSGISGTGPRLRAALGLGRGEVAYCKDFADPFVLRAGKHYYAYSTQSGPMNVPVMRVAGLFDSGRRHDALPQLPRWSKPGGVWAPAVLATGKSYLLYYTTIVASTGAECLSRATAQTPDGPFVDPSTGPWICPTGQGAIDASPYTAADGHRYLVWKNAGDDFFGIASAQLSDDGLQLASPVAHLLTATQPWEAGTVEGPDLAAAKAGEWLFYSGGDWRTSEYAIGVAHCAGPLGPCTKIQPDPLVASIPNAAGPGGQQLFTDGAGRSWMVFHAWVNGRAGYPDGGRGLFVVPISRGGAVPRVGGFDQPPT